MITDYLRLLCSICGEVRTHLWNGEHATCLSCQGVTKL